MSKANAKKMTTTEHQDYKVADIGLADFGRKEIGIAENEMPGLWPPGKNTETNNP